MRLIFALLLMYSAALAGAQAPAAVQAPLAERLSAVLEESPVTRRTFVGVHVIDAATSAVLFSQYPDNLFTPASNMKLYTSACALDTWGPDHRFETHVLINGPVTPEGDLQGDLILRGGGDPVLTSAHLAELARKVVEERKITRILGNVVVDDSLFDGKLKGPGWMWDDDPDYYNMSVNALMVDYNVMKVALAQENGRITAKLNPPGDYPPIAVREPLEGNITVTRKPFNDVVVVTGDGSAAPFRARSVELTMHEPSRWAGGVFVEMLRAAGAEVRGHVEVERFERQEGELILTHTSEPMSRILALFNKPSENAIGEVLLHDLAVEAGERPATWSMGAQVITDWLVNEAGLSAGEFRLVDGSGLSRYNSITPAGTVKLLHHMWEHPHRQVYIDSLPMIRVEGTTTDRVFAKTGGMASVSCLSGYVNTEDGDWLIFSILMNGFTGSSSGPIGLRNRLLAEMVK